MADAPLEDVGESRARLSRDALASLDASEGDPIVLRGRDQIVARVMPAGPEDDGLRIVRLDGGQRSRLGVELGGTIEAEVPTITGARSVRLLLLGAGGDPAFTEGHLHESLDGRVVTIGDTAVLTPDRRRFEAELSVLGLNVAGIAGTSSDDDGVLARVVSTEPSGLVRIDPQTKLLLDDVTSSDDPEDSAPRR